MSRKATTVSGSGVALVPYDLINFTCTVSAFSDVSGPDAKAQIKDTIAALHGYYLTLKDEDKTRNKRSSMAVTPHTQYTGRDREHVSGYQAMYTLEFSTLDVGAVSEIHDQLTSIEGVSAAAPEYTFLDPEKHRRSALEQAWLLVKERFYHQCEVLSVSPGDFKIETWAVDFNDRREVFSKVANLAEDAVGSAAPDIDGGVARVKVTLNVTYSYDE